MKRVGFPKISLTSRLLSMHKAARAKQQPPEMGQQPPPLEAGSDKPACLGKLCQQLVECKEFTLICGTEILELRNFPPGCDYLVIASIPHSHFCLERMHKERLLVRIYQLVNSQGVAFKATLEKHTGAQMSLSSGW